MNRTLKVLCGLLVILAALRYPVIAVSAEEIESISEELPIEAVKELAEETIPVERVEEAEATQALSHPVPVYFQTDYPDVRYGAGSIATSGCSVTSLAMVATYMTGHTYMPDELADYFSAYNSINHIDKLEYMLRRVLKVYSAVTQ